MDQERNISNAVESKVNKGIAGIGTIKKSEKMWIRYLLDTLKIIKKTIRAYFE